MTLVSIHSIDGKLRCELTQGKLFVEGEATTFIGALAKTYLRLLIRRLKTLKRRETWKER
jgi:hypothetical protein